MRHSVHTNRPPLLASLSSLAVMAAILFSAATAASAQTPSKKALVGSWVETVTFPPDTGRPPLKSLGTFNSDGTMVCSDQGSVTTSGMPGVFTSCHGVWTHLHHRTFAYTSRELISDLSGNLVGYLKVRGEYTGVSVAEVRDTGGTLLFSAEVTNAGKRIQVELP